MSKNDYFEYMYQIDEEYERRLNDDHARWPKTNPTISNLKISKEEKKMHKKRRVHGHVVHKLPKCVGLYYTVEPEHSCIAVYILMYDPDQEVEAASYNIPAALYDIYNPAKPFRNVEEVRSLLRAIHAKRAMWKNASYMHFYEV